MCIRFVVGFWFILYLLVAAIEAVAASESDSRYVFASNIRDFDGYRADGDSNLLQDYLLLQQYVAENPKDGEARSQLSELLEQLRAAGMYGPPLLGHDTQPDAEVQLGATRLSHASWIALHLGYDDNINSAPGIPEIQVPRINYRSLTLPDYLQRHAGRFAMLQAGGTLAYPLSPRSRVNAEFQGALRINTPNYEYLPHNYRASVGFDRLMLGGVMGVEIGKEQSWLASIKAIDTSHTSLQFKKSLSEQFHLGTTIHSNRHYYPRFDRIQTVDRGVSVQFELPQLHHTLELVKARESALSGLSDLDRDYVSVGVVGRFDLRGGSSMTWGCRVTRSDYAKESVLFLAERKERHTDCRLSYEQHLGSDWFLGPSLIYEKNRSTLDLTRYQRRQLFISMRKIF